MTVEDDFTTIRNPGACVPDPPTSRWSRVRGTRRWSRLPSGSPGAARPRETVAKALESGAADYIVKPFSPTELVARIRAALRRSEEPEPFVVGDLAIDYARRRVTVGGEAVELTATEYDLLRVLSLDAGRVVTFETLLRLVWGKDDEKAKANLVRNFVRNVRRKLGDSPANPVYLFNERGVGYRMAKPPDR